MDDQNKSSELIDLASWWSRSASPAETATYLKRATLVRRLKRILPIAGGILLAIALIWPIVKPDLPIADWARQVKSTGSELAMLDLTYRGANDKGEPFTVTADKATRNVPLGMDAKKESIAPMIGLTTPQANVLNQDGTQTDIKANTGTYDETAQGLNLNGDVRITKSDGMQLDAPQLSVDFKQNRAWTDQPVTASGTFGTISGEGMQLEDGGKIIIFTGQTKATLNGNRKAQPEAVQEPSQDASQAQPNQP